MSRIGKETRFRGSSGSEGDIESALSTDRSSREKQRDLARPSPALPAALVPCSSSGRCVARYCVRACAGAGGVATAAVSPTLSPPASKARPLPFFRDVFLASVGASSTAFALVRGADPCAA